jgi:hypothetical protein
LRIDLAIGQQNAYTLTLTPLANPGSATTTTGTLSGPINWFQFELFNTDSDFYPTEIANRAETDFYISEMWVVPEPANFALLSLGGMLLLPRHGRTTRRIYNRRTFPKVEKPEGLFLRIEAEGMIVAARHFPEPGFGRIAQSGGRRYWQGIGPPTNPA